ncbi:MAG: family 10 glycosylhydrolase [Sedimentisphaerales bacterium]|nr:family 10 glycosylhydrolase [Sedimentisphaerales bacterium]
MKAVLASLLLVVLFSTTVFAAQPAELRGIWMHATSIKTPAEADAAIAKIERAHLNAVFLLVWYWGGQAFFQSSLCPMGEGVQPGYDPLGYMVEQCHKRGIQIHAWFVNGAYGTSEPGYILSRRPDWGVKDGTGWTNWYDFGKPEVRRFQSDLMIECLVRYDLDGIHFDYIRYGPHQCYCDHCQREFAARYGDQPLTDEQQKTFPIGAGIAANPLIAPSTATILATLSDGTPAIASNVLGKGQVLLLNWHAETEMSPAVAETVRLLLGIWTVGGSAPIHLLTTEQNRAEYGLDSLEAARASLRRLGYPAQMILPEQINALPADSTIVLPAVYLIPFQASRDLEQFVKRGGRMLIIDGPTKSITLGPIQHITGFTRAGRYIRRDDVIQSTGRSPLVPRGKHQIDVTHWKYRMKRWAEYRKADITELVRDVYSLAKKYKPKAQVTAAVFPSLEAADSVYQDWPRWLRDDTIDYVIPMAYTDNTIELQQQIARWKTVDRHLDRIVPGLSIYRQIDGKTVTRQLDLIRRQQRLCRKEGAHGNMYFSLQYLNDPLIDLFRKEFYPTEAPAYAPPDRKSPPPSKPPAETSES